MNEHSNEWIPWHWHLWRVQHYVTCINIFYRNLMFNLHWFDENQKTNQYLSICHPNKLLILQLENLWKMKKSFGILKFSMGLWFYISLYIFGTTREIFKINSFFNNMRHINDIFRRKWKDEKNIYSKWILKVRLWTMSLSIIVEWIHEHTWFMQMDPILYRWYNIMSRT
jgi:hypothetical protein